MSILDMIDAAIARAEDDFERFSPTSEQVTFAQEYLAETGLDTVMVAVNFPGKEYGIWLNGQVREAVMDGSRPAIWTDRDSALYAMEHGVAGNAIFRVYADGHSHCVMELM